jgi:hypothetical protein
VVSPPPEPPRSLIIPVSPLLSTAKSKAETGNIHTLLFANCYGFSVGLRTVVMYPGGYTSVNSNDTSDEDER